MSNTILPAVSELPRPKPELVLMRELSNEETRVCHWQSAHRLWPDSWKMQLPLNDCCRLVLPYRAIKRATDRIDPCDPPWMGVKSTTTSNDPSTS